MRLYHFTSSGILASFVNINWLSYKTFYGNLGKHRISIPFIFFLFFLINKPRRDGLQFIN